ncbi:hypothetical protein BLA29_000024 [Euroglyphus maynei]|uniref:Uncharacterized protein n=1 Tax=Euroglyphus maynei TaxID=6958 RepID=A0A1Y3BD67_EURMA|nr:hypothetical protein BLA29_000024 [Euroglyphus maynei]
MLKLTLIFLIGIAYAAQTRIKIGSKSWGYQIDLNHGQQVRNEFSNEDGVTTGFYLFRNNDNQTKKLQYTIDSNRLQPDVEFDVISVDDGEYNSSGCLPPNSNINYKFNSTSADPTFEVSLFKSSSELETIGRDYRERDYLNNINYRHHDSSTTIPNWYHNRSKSIEP